MTEINSKHSTLAHQPLLFLKQDIAFVQYVGLLTVADVLMVTSMREGLNLTCHEYILCQDGNGADKKHGPLILSEFAGSSSLFGDDQLAVNPWDLQQVSKAIKHALEMDPAEKKRRHENMKQVVEHHNGIHWFSELQHHLNDAYEANQYRDTLSVPRLPVHMLCEAYLAAKKRLFILDYEGTLANWGPPRRSVLASPQRLVDTLASLMLASEDNIIYVSSARRRDELELQFQQLPGLGLIAENGCFVRPFDKSEWIDIASMTGMTSDWKEGVTKLLTYYQERMEGSWIDDAREHSVIFHYEDVHNSEMDGAERQAGDAANHIGESCESQRMRAVPLNRAIMVEPIDIDKKTAAKWILKRLLRPDLDPTSITVQHTHNPGRHDNHEISSRGRDTATSTHSQAHIVPDQGIAREQRSNSTRSTDVHSREGRSSTGTPSLDPGSPTTSFSAFSPEFGPQDPDANDSCADARVSIDFLMVAGDDREDEGVFRWANTLGRAYERRSGVSDTRVAGIKKVFSICVGKKNTEASFSLTQGVTGESCGFRD